MAGAVWTSRSTALALACETDSVPQTILRLKASAGR